MSVILECIGCRVKKEFPSEINFPICDDCLRWEQKHLRELHDQTSIINTCPLCGYRGAAIQKHHIHGRKNSPETVAICANCHVEIHLGLRELS